MAAKVSATVGDTRSTNEKGVYEMRNLKTAGLALASMLLVGMALAGNASAVILLWLVCLKSVGLTKYENNKCLTSKPTQTRGEEGWQSLGVPKGTSISIKLLPITIILRDNGTLGGPTTVTCYSRGSVGRGLIEAEGKGKVEEAFVENPGTNCSATGACAGTLEKVEAAHLPWETELIVGANGKPLTKIKGTNGKPGWTVKCGIFTDECLEETAPEEVELISGISEFISGVKELLVVGRFQTAHPAKCSVGGAGQGEVKGLLAILLPGGALSIITSEK
jgi:hypothetical protein